MDRSISVATHRPIGIPDAHISSPLPVAISADKAKAKFIHHVRLRRIQSEVYEVNYSTKSLQILGVSSYDDWLSSTDLRLLAWRQDVLKLTSEGAKGFDWFDFVIATVQIYSMTSSLIQLYHGTD